MSRFKFRKPSPSMVVALAALFVAMGGSAVAASRLFIHSRNIANGAVTNHKIANGAVGFAKLGKPIRAALTIAGKPRGVIPGANGQQGAQGQKGDGGAPGSNGTNGRDGANPGSGVVTIPAVTPGEKSANNNPDSGAAGDGGWFFSGTGAGGSESLAGGELRLTGTKVDSNTFQGGFGVAHAYSNIPLGKLDTLAFDYNVTAVHGGQTPLVHVTVTGLTADSKFGSGFANLVYSPALNNGNATPEVGVTHHADGFAPGTDLWYSTTETSISNTGSQDHPQPLSYFVGRNASAVITQVALDNGGSSGSSAGTFAAGADALALGLAGDGSFTRYDFGG
ncbi:MAG: hypothetical protein ACRDNK_09280 [Solirubrobacteraceae bacterium]